MGTCMEETRNDCAAINPLSVLYMGLNLCSSISIVLVNKWLFNNSYFRFPTFLTMLHFAFTFLGLQVCACLGLFTPKRLNLWRVSRLSAAFCGFVVLTNISLQLNSVGFYQVAKVLTTPVIALIELVAYGKRLARPLVASLSLVCAGILYSTVTDVQLNLNGTLVAAAGVLVTSLYQIWVGTEQKDLQANALQLLYYQAPVAALMLLPAIPLLDDVGALHAYEPSQKTLWLILASCAIALFVNLSTFLVIGSTSPLSYNVLGHSKLTLVVVGGFLLFGYAVDVHNLCGMGLVLAGVVWYTHLKLRAQSAAKATVAAEEETRLLDAEVGLKSPQTPRV